MEKKGGNVIIAFFRESYEELTKVVWPNKEETTKAVIAVISISLFLALFAALFDALFSWVFNLLLTI